jgi:hypothetical protein
MYIGNAIITVKTFNVIVKYIDSGIEKEVETQQFVFRRSVTQTAVIYI